MFARYELIPDDRGGNPCPRRVAGKRCKRFTRREPQPRCICEMYPLLFDHDFMWRTKDRARVLTLEPYNYNGKDAASVAVFEAFRLDCEALGLEARIEPFSPWYPGSTTLITVHRRKS